MAALGHSVSSAPEAHLARHKQIDCAWLPSDSNKREANTVGEGNVIAADVVGVFVA